jgi:auxin-responsive protein IAA
MMSPPLLSAEEGEQSNVSLVASSPSMDCISQNGSGLKERNYMGLSDCSSVDSSPVSSLSEEKKNNLNLKATELRLGLPGSQSPDRKPELCLLNTGKLDEKPLFPLLPSKEGICSSSQKNIVSGNKRGFSDTVDGFSEVKSSVYTTGNWMYHAVSDSESPQSVGQGKFPGSSGMNVVLSSRPSGAQSPIMKELPTKVLQERPHATNGTSHNNNTATNGNSSAPAPK